MSKSIKSVAKIALPVALAYFAPGIGNALGSTLAESSLGAIGGAIGGGISGAMDGGGLKGALKGAAIGGAGGYLSNGGAGELFGGTKFGDAIGVSAPNANIGYSPGEIASGAIGTTSAPVGAAATGAGARSLGNALAIGQVGNALMTGSALDATEEATRQQQAGLEAAKQAQAPYTQLGSDAVSQIQNIQKDPAGYIQNSEFYGSLAKDAERRLLASEAAKGKVGSGGTAAALQEQLLTLGNGLVNSEVGRLQTQANTGAEAASNVSNLDVGSGNVASAGTVGANNVMQTGYQNSLGALLALQGVSNTPPFNPNEPQYI